MSMTKYLFTSESVTEGHPDKVADQVSDAILDDIISKDKKARVACETVVTTGLVLIAGEITCDCYSDMPSIVRKTIKDIGYRNSSMGFDWETCAVLTSIDQQSPDIAMGVNESEDHEQGAGDQGLMFGYACDETEALMPMPIYYAHKITERLAEVRKTNVLPFLRPDGKSQVTVEYEEDRPVRVNTVVVAAQHNPEVNLQTLREAIVEEVVKKVIPANLLSKDVKYYVNATGRFVVGGPLGDCGVTGRKIIADTYGGQGSHGGGAFSGKDPSKVDRSASYMARYVAKNVVAAGLARTCELQVSYAIGVAQPVSVMINTYGTSRIAPDRIAEIVRKNFDLRPKAMIAYLDLLRPIYRKTAAYGHFGRPDPDFTWEKTDRAELLKSEAGL